MEEALAKDFAVAERNEARLRELERPSTLSNSRLQDDVKKLSEAIVAICAYRWAHADPSRGPLAVLIDTSPHPLIRLPSTLWWPACSEGAVISILAWRLCGLLFRPNSDPLTIRYRTATRKSGGPTAGLEVGICFPPAEGEFPRSDHSTP